MLELHGGGQHDVGEARRVGQVVLEHDGVQVVARETAQHLRLVGRDRRRVRVPHDQRRHGRVEVGGRQRLAEARHVERARRAALEAGPLEHAGVERVGGRARDVREPAAAVPPRSGERRDAGDRPVRDRRAGVALGADAETDQRRLHGRDLARQRADRVGVDVAQRRRTGRPGSRRGARPARRSRRRSRGTTPRRRGPRRAARAGCRARARRRCRAAGVRCWSATRAVRLRNGSITTSFAPFLRAIVISRHRCGAVDIGFQPQQTISRACGHSSGSTSGDCPVAMPTPTAPADAQMVRTRFERRRPP